MGVVSSGLSRGPRCFDSRIIWENNISGFDRKGT
jgi:hypothetical protein